MFPVCLPFEDADKEGSIFLGLLLFGFCPGFGPPLAAPGPPLVLAPNSYSRATDQFYAAETNEKSLKFVLRNPEWTADLLTGLDASRRALRGVLRMLESVWPLASAAAQLCFVVL